MNYYHFHIGDFRSGTINMSRQARWIYRDMLDVYYDSEKPLSLDLDVLCDAIGVSTKEERESVERLLRFKFKKTDDGYRHEICDEVISDFHQKAEIARSNGKLGGRKKNSQKVPSKKPSGFQMGTDSVHLATPDPARSQANQEPITNNQEPEEKNTTAQSARRDQVASVFDHWRQVMSHQKSVMDAKRRKLIESRMKDGYTEEDLKSAIDGCARSSFHMGDNERQQRYDGLDLILRDAAHVDKFLSLDRNPPMVVPPTKVTLHSESFRERDDRLAKERYAEMVGRAPPSREIFDIIPTTLEIDHASDQSR